MHRVYIVSLFEGCEGKMNKFHFIGFYQGIKIKKVFIEDGEFELNEAYIVALSPLEIRGSVLYGKFIKSKKLFS